jgi:hypothetical protein
VSFKGTARELSIIESGRHLLPFLERWPRARDAITPERLAHGATRTRLYQVTVTEWVLFDEVDHPDQPRQSLPGLR